MQRLCFQKPQKLNINATYIAVCFSITISSPEYVRVFILVALARAIGLI